MRNQLSIYLIIIVFFTACRVNYSFREGAIPADINSITIQNFVNESGSGPPNMPQVLTEGLKSFYQDNSRLTLTNTNGDWQLSGSILGYAVTPIAPQGAQQQAASINRLTITVNAKFVNTKDEKQDFQQSFNFYYDFPQSQSLNAVEAVAIQEIFNQIILDIFNRTTSTW
jgi:hypothetical protein